MSKENNKENNSYFQKTVSTVIVCHCIATLLRNVLSVRDGALGDIFTFPLEVTEQDYGPQRSS